MQVTAAKMGTVLSTVVFRPPQPPPRKESSGLLLTTAHGNRIPAIFLNKGAPHTLLLSHGNAEDLWRIADWARALLFPNIRANILLYEYTGYGDGQRPCEAFVYSDAEAAMWLLTESLQVPLGEIVLYGRSLGSGPTCYLAEKHANISGVILEAPITSVLRVIADFRFTFPGDMFPNIDRMRNITCPLLLLQGSRDEIVPLSHSEALLQACPSPKKQLVFIEGAGHNDIQAVAGLPLFQVIQQFLDSL